MLYSLGSHFAPFDRLWLASASRSTKPHARRNARRERITIFSRRAMNWKHESTLCSLVRHLPIVDAMKWRKNNAYRYEFTSLGRSRGLD